MNEDITEIQLYEEEDLNIREDSTYSSLLRLYIMFIFMWQSTFKLSDAGTNVLFTIIASFLLLLATKVASQALKDFCGVLPRNIPSARKIVGQTRELFQKWVCCPSCSSLYSIENLKTKESNGQVVSRKCGFVRYPNHPQSRYRQPCGAMLLKSV